MSLYEVTLDGFGLEMLEQTPNGLRRTAIGFVKNQIVWSRSKEHAKAEAIKQVQKLLLKLQQKDEIKILNLRFESATVSDTNWWFGLFRQAGFIFFPSEAD
jgi:hypothetical protein